MIHSGGGRFCNKKLLELGVSYKKNVYIPDIDLHLLDDNRFIDLELNHTLHIETE